MLEHTKIYDFHKAVNKMVEVLKQLEDLDPSTARPLALEYFAETSDSVALDEFNSIGKLHLDPAEELRHYSIDVTILMLNHQDLIKERKFEVMVIPKYELMVV